MNISLTKQLEAYIKAKVETGNFHSASEVVRAGLRLLQERDEQLDWLRKEVQLGLDDIEAGRVVEFDENLLEEIKKRGRERLQATRKRSA